MRKINISDENGRTPISSVAIFDTMSEEEAEIVFGESETITKEGERR